MDEILNVLKIDNQKIVLDFCKKNYITISAKQYDHKSRHIIIQLARNGKPIKLTSDFTAQVKILTPNDRALLEDLVIIQDEDENDEGNNNGALLLELTESMLYVPGKAKGEIVIYDNSDPSDIRRASTMSFNIVIDSSVYSDDRVIDADEFNALTRLYEKALKDYSYVMENAQASADSAKESETNAEVSKTAAANSASSAETSANNANIFADNSKASETNAKVSEENAKISEENAKTSELNAKALETSYTTSATIAENKAAESAINAESASVSATNAATSEKNASASAESAKTSADIATTKANEASSSADEASVKAKEASDYADNASTSATIAAKKANEISETALLSKSYAVGTNDEVRDGDSTDNAQYYYEQSKRIVQGSNGLVPIGTITFAELSNEDYHESGYMFNISDSFITDETFKEGSGHLYGEGTNVYRTADGYWDALVGSNVTGVKGEAESNYRQGNINITLGNLGVNVTADKLNYMDGVTDNVQTQLNNLSESINNLDIKQDLTDLGVTATAEELNHVSGVTSNIQEQLDTSEQLVNDLYNGIDTLSDEIDALYENKVNKEEGKGLFSGSYNDLTDTPKIDTVATSDSENLITSNGVYRGLETKAPTSHASTETTYGIGDETNYGHVRVSSNIANPLGDGIAASQSALCNAYNGLNNSKISCETKTTSTTVTGAASGVATGAVNNGRYFKFSDGTLICAHKISWTGAADIPWGSMYETATFSLGNWATKFSVEPYISITSQPGQGQKSGLVQGVWTTSNEFIGYTQLMRPESIGSTTYYLDVIGIGRWK